MAKGRRVKTPHLPALTDRTLIASFFGLGDDGGPCPLPGHHGQADLERHGKDLRFVCDCTGRSAGWDHKGKWRSEYGRSLADAYWSLRTGVVIGRGFMLRNALRFVSRLLLSGELGLIDPVPVELPAIPQHLPAHYSEGREFFSRLYGLREADDPERVKAEGIAFSKRLVAAWLHCSEQDAWLVIDYLRREGVIVQIGRDGERGPYLYAPGQVSNHQGAGTQPSVSQRARS